jgi:hypothetical protein
MKNLGTKISKVATPIARAIGHPCIDPATGQPRPESGCGKMIVNLNAGMGFADAIYDRFFQRSAEKQKEKNAVHSNQNC